MKSKIFLACIIGFSFLGAGCSTTQLAQFQTASANFQATVATINADIAAVAPTVAKYCGDLQTAAMLLAPLVGTKAKAPQYFAAANGALNSYCQSAPNVNSVGATASALAKAVAAAQAGYNTAVGR